MVIFLYSILAYIIGLVGQVWFILYLGEWNIVQTIHQPQHSSTWFAVVMDVVLVLIFALQHSVMARSWFKEKITCVIPAVIERSTYVLLSGVTLLLIVLYWQPIDGDLWRFENGVMWWILTGMMLFGWFFSVVATFVINHFELFGLQQGYLHLKDEPTPTVNFQEKFLYKFIRHPIQLGVLMGVWFTPVMTYGHLLLSILFTLYIFIGLHYEEKDLMTELGSAYLDYKKRVGMMIPKRSNLFSKNKEQYE